MTLPGSKYKIAHLITGLSRGGAELFLKRLIEQMDESRFESVVISMTGLGKLGEGLLARGIRVRSLGMSQGIPHPRGMWHFNKLVREERPELVQSWLYHADLLGSIAALRGIPVIWNIRCSTMEFDRYSPLTLCSVRLLAGLSAFIPRVAVVNSHAGRRVHEELGYRPRAWAVIQNGVDTHHFRPKSNACFRQRDEWGIRSEASVISRLGRFDPMKDYDTAFRAMALVVRELPGTVLLLAGGGMSADNKRLVSLLSKYGLMECTVLAGDMEDPLPAYHASDIVISSSKGEGFPNVVAEAMACGVSCVVTDAGDSRDLVGETGIVVPPGDWRSLAEGICRILRLNHEERTNLSGSARRRVVEEFSMSTAVARYEALYESIIQKTEIRRG